MKRAHASPDDGPSEILTAHRFLCVFEECAYGCDELSSYTAHIISHTTPDTLSNDADLAVRKIRAILTVNKEIISRIDEVEKNDVRFSSKLALEKHDGLYHLSEIVQKSPKNILSGPSPIPDIVFERQAFMEMSDADLSPSNYAGVKKLHQQLCASVEHAIRLLKPVGLPEQLEPLRMECEKMQGVVGAYEEALRASDMLLYTPQVAELNKLRREYKKKKEKLQRSLNKAFVASIEDLTWTAEFHDEEGVDLLSEPGLASMARRFSTKYVRVFHVSLPVVDFSITLSGITSALELIVGLVPDRLRKYESMESFFSTGYFLNLTTGRSSTPAIVDCTRLRVSDFSYGGDLKIRMQVEPGARPTQAPSVSGSVRFTCDNCKFPKMYIPDISVPLYPCVVVSGIGHRGVWEMKIIKEKCVLGKL